MKKIVALLLNLIFVSTFSFSDVERKLLKQLTTTQFELYTYEKRVEYLEQKVSDTKAACIVRFNTHMMLEEIALIPRKKFFQSKKKFLAEEKEYLARKQERLKKIQEANAELSQMPEYQELQLAKDKIEKLKEKIQEILILLQRSKE